MCEWFNKDAVALGLIPVLYAEAVLDGHGGSHRASMFRKMRGTHRFSPAILNGRAAKHVTRSKRKIPGFPKGNLRFADAFRALFWEEAGKSISNLMEITRFTV